MIDWRKQKELKIILRAFEKLEGKFEVKNLRESVYLAFMKPISVYEIVHPTREPRIQQAKFEFRGKYKKNLPIYELVEIK